jgi:DNA-binding transcriptional LysR family regulator
MTRPSAAALGVELRHLRTFVVVAEELHFTRAADRLQLAQQAVSTQIRQLEQRLGTRLLDRSTRHVALTPAGARLLAAARTALERADRAVAAALAPASTDLRVVFAGTGVLALTPALVRAFAAERPQDRLKVGCTAAGEPAAVLAQTGADAVLVRDPAPSAGIETETLLEEPRVVALPEDHPLAGEDVLRAGELVEEDWVAPAGRDGWTVGGAREPVAAAGSFEESVELVRHGLGVALVPASLASPRPGVVFRPVAGVAPTRVALARRDGDDRPELESLLAAARTAAREPAEEPALPPRMLRAVPDLPAAEPALVA